MTIPTPTTGDVTDEMRRVRHKKRGSTYAVVGLAELQIAHAPVMEGSKLVIYRCEEDGKLWAREFGEFEDGRFEDIEAPPPGATVTEWVTVPREPTPDQIKAAHKVWNDHQALANKTGGHGSTMAHPYWETDYYRAMIEAAPPMSAEPVALKPNYRMPRMCESKGASDYCRHCGRFIDVSGPCSFLEASRLKEIPDDEIAAFGCQIEAEYPEEGERCVKWCHRDYCPYSLKAIDSAPIVHPDTKVDLTADGPRPDTIISDELTYALDDAFVTTTAGDGKPYITIQMDELKHCHRLYDALAKFSSLQRTPSDRKAITAALSSKDHPNE